MRRLHIIASLDPASGGPVEGLIQLERSLAGSTPADVVTLDPPNAPFLNTFPLSAIPLGRSTRRPSPRFWGRYGYSPRLVSWLRAHVGRYDAAIVHGLWNYAAFGAARVLPSAGVAYFVFAHGMMDPWFRRRSPLKHLGKQVSWLAGEGRLLARARAVLFTTQEEQQLAHGQFWGHRYRGAVVGFGVTSPPAPTRGQAEAFQALAPALGGRRYLLFLGRIHGKKGLDLLIQSFAGIASRQPNLDLVVLGSGDPELVRSMQALARQLDVQHRVHWPGWLHGDAKWGAVRGAEALALLSHQENFGVAVAEALACGLPVLVSDRINIWHEIETAGAGLIGTDTREGAAALLARWVDMAPAERVAMGQAAKALFDDRFDAAKVAPALIETMRSLR